MDYPGKKKSPPKLTIESAAPLVWWIEVKTGDKVVYCADIEGCARLAAMHGQNPNDFQFFQSMSGPLAVAGPVQIRMFKDSPPLIDNDE